MRPSVPLFLLALLLLSEPGCSKGLLPALDISRLESAGGACRADLDTLRSALDDDQLWALTMVDASVRSPVGLLSQTETQYGDFDECLTVVTPITPQFCLADFTPVHTNNSLWPFMKLGLCMPASCSPEEVRVSLQSFLDGEVAPGEEVKVGLVPAACTTKDTLYTNITMADVIYSALFGGLILMVVAATVHEVTARPGYDGVSPPLSATQCLSARHGWYSLMRADQQIPGVNMSALYGLHTSAFFFVVLGHRFGVHLYFMSLTNYRGVQQMFTDSFYSLWTGHMDLFVDIFFFMSAFLLSVFYYAELHKRYVTPVKVYLYRIFRIVPAYAVVVFFYATWLRQLGDGPFWNMFMDVEQSKCQNYWWTNLLFINNYVQPENKCLIQSWYITCDFQLFLVGTLLVYLLQQRPRLGLVVSGVVFVLSTIAPFLGTYLYNRPALLLFYKEFWANPRIHEMFNSVYSQGHFRGTSYLLGLLSGCYVYSRRQQEPISRGRTYLLQAGGLLCSLVVYWSGALFYNPTHSPDRLVAAVYAALYHTVFGVGMAMMFVAFTLGKSTFWTRMFAWKGFVPLSKLSYCVYLVHNIPQFIWIASSRTTVYLNPLELVSWSIADTVISLVAALILYLTVETPIRYLVKFWVAGSPSTPLPQVATKPKEKYTIQEETYNFDKR